MEERVRKLEIQVDVLAACLRQVMYSAPIPASTRRKVLDYFLEDVAKVAPEIRELTEADQLTITHLLTFFATDPPTC